MQPAFQPYNVPISADHLRSFMPAHPGKPAVNMGYSPFGS